MDDPVEARAIWYVRRGRVRSCVRPTLRGLMTAGPDAIRSLAPKQIYALEWRITLDGIVNLAARSMLVVSVARRLESEGPLLAYCAARSNRAGPQKGALGPLS